MISEYRTFLREKYVYFYFRPIFQLQINERAMKELTHTRYSILESMHAYRIYGPYFSYLCETITKLVHNLVARFTSGTL